MGSRSAVWCRCDAYPAAHPHNIERPVYEGKPCPSEPVDPIAAAPVPPAPDVREAVMEALRLSFLGPPRPDAYERAADAVLAVPAIAAALEGGTGEVAIQWGCRIGEGDAHARDGESVTYNHNGLRNHAESQIAHAPETRSLVRRKVTTGPWEPVDQGEEQP